MARSCWINSQGLWGEWRFCRDGPRRRWPCLAHTPTPSNYGRSALTWESSRRRSVAGRRRSWAQNANDMVFTGITDAAQRAAVNLTYTTVDAATGAVAANFDFVVGLTP